MWINTGLLSIISTRFFEIRLKSPLKVLIYIPQIHTVGYSLTFHILLFCWYSTFWHFIYLSPMSLFLFPFLYILTLFLPIRFLFRSLDSDSSPTFSSLLLFIIFDKLTYWFIWFLIGIWSHPSDTSPKYTIIGAVSQLFELY